MVFCWKISPQAKRHRPSLHFTSLTILISIWEWCKKSNKYKFCLFTYIHPLNKLAKLRRHVSRVQFTKINFGKMSETRNLKRRMKKHTGKKSYRCFQCDQLFSQPSSLRLHLKSHTGDKPNQCNLCEFASIRPVVLKTHLTTHNRQKS